MADDDVLKTAVRLGASVDALAALAAHLRLETEQLPADPAVRELLETIAAELVGDDAPDPATAAPTIGLARTFLRQATELVENPGRSGGWDQVDVPLLQSVGRLSMGISAALLAAERRLPDLGDRLSAPDASVPGRRNRHRLAGDRHRAITPDAARRRSSTSSSRRSISPVPTSRVRALPTGSSCGCRTPRCSTSRTATTPFGWRCHSCPRAVVVPIVNAAVRSLKPGGWLLPGTFTGPGDRLSELLTDLRTVRSGGHPWRPEEIIDMLATAGLSDAQEIPREWPAPVRLYAGLRR